MSSNTPAAGDPPADVSVAEICRRAGVTEARYYYLARKGKAPRSNRGVPFEQAKEWLEARAARKRARAEGMRRLSELCAPDAKEGRDG